MKLAELPGNESHFQKNEPSASSPRFEPSENNHMFTLRNLTIATFGMTLAAPLDAAPEVLDEGLYLDASQMSGLFNWPYPLTGRSVSEFSNYNGALWLYSFKKESAQAALDGGITLYGSPVSIVLGNDDWYSNGFYQDDSKFSVWKPAKWGSPNPANKPLFEINGLAGTAIFDSVGLQVNNGSLTVGGSPVLRAADTGTFSPRGNVSNNASWAGGNAIASGNYAISNGMSGTIASGAYANANGPAATASGIGSIANGFGAVGSGAYSRAEGFNVTASGTFSTARGQSSKALGHYSAAIGHYVEAYSFGEIALGSANLRLLGSVENWLPQEYLFHIGNGTSDSARSDALTILKNGQTTLTNKDWKTDHVANPSSALNDPASSADSGGNALVIDGHAVLNGKVTISVPQGDISMGIYE